MMGAVVSPKIQLANVLKVDLTEFPKPMDRAVMARYSVSRLATATVCLAVADATLKRSNIRMPNVGL